jgi:hypothetical protein
MRGAADYIYLVEALRNLEQENARLQKIIDDQPKAVKILQETKYMPDLSIQVDHEKTKELLESNDDLMTQVCECMYVFLMYICMCVCVCVCMYI